MLISARYGKGADWEQLVFTGSPNFTKDGLVERGRSDDQDPGQADHGGLHRQL